MHRKSVIDRRLAPAGLFASVCALALACSDKPAKTSATADAPAAPQTLTLGSYTTPREAYAAILPAFSELYGKSHKQALSFNQSYLGSGAQARAIASGFEADVAALSLEPDIEVLRKAGLIHHDWKAGPHAGVVTRSIVVIGVREGNPKQIRDWDDLAKPGLTVLTPNVRTSGGARWNVAAIWGAAMRGKTSAKAGDEEAATKLLAAILRNVHNMDAGARESLLQFERGVGDAIITYENEILVGRNDGQKYEYVIPTSTILIENPAALVDRYVDKHGTREPSRALLDFLVTTEAQRIYATHGLRPVAEEVAKETAAIFRTPSDLFTIRDLGDWAGSQREVFDSGAGYDRALALANGGS